MCKSNRIPFDLCVEAKVAKDIAMMKLTTSSSTCTYGADIVCSETM